MHADPVCIATTVKVKDVHDILTAVSQPLYSKLNGFPVVRDVPVGGVTLRVYQGTILLQNLCVLLRTKRFYMKDPVTGELIRVHDNDLDSPRLYGNNSSELAMEPLNHSPAMPSQPREHSESPPTGDSASHDEETDGEGGVGPVPPSPATHKTVSTLRNASVYHMDIIVTDLIGIYIRLFCAHTYILHAKRTLLLGVGARACPGEK
eukprot:COSAG05_NODE_4502_length_1487_cov_4.031526_1_plen_205_part_10